MKFGFLRSVRVVNAQGILIEPLSTHREALAEFYETAHVSDGWVYGPEMERAKTDQERNRFKNRPPKWAQSFFHLPCTHQLIANDLDDEQLRFVVLAYGFLNGLYLAAEGYACIRKVPYHEGKLSRLALGGKDNEIGIRKIREFLLSSNKQQVKTMTAVLHWFLVGQSYEFEWDRFDAQYKVLDGIYRVSCLKSSSHAQRPVDLVQHWAKYGIVLPEWAKIDDGRSSKLSRMRNDLFHEAIYAGMPIGYSYPEENYDHEFVSFNVKLIAALFQIDTPYLRAPPDDRMQWIWDMK